MSTGGNLIFNGDILMEGLGWPGQAAGGQGLSTVVSALVAQVGEGVGERKDKGMGLMGGWQRKPGTSQAKPQLSAAAVGSASTCAIVVMPHDTAHAALPRAAIQPCPCSVATPKPQSSAAVVEFEDLSLAGDMPASLMGGDKGQAAIRGLLKLPPVTQLDGMPANFSLTGPQGGCELETPCQRAGRVPGRGCAALALSQMHECSFTAPCARAENRGDEASQTAPACATPP